MGSIASSHRTRSREAGVAKFIVELWLDGYDSEEEMEKACEEFIYEQLNMTASCVKITKSEKQGGDRGE